MLRIKLSSSIAIIAKEDPTVKALICRCLKVYEERCVGTYQHFELDDTYTILISPYRSANYDYVPFGTNPRQSYDVRITRAFRDLVLDPKTIIVL